MEKTSFCDECCGTELFRGCCWTLSFSFESAAEYAAISGLLTFFRENLLKKNEVQRRKNYRKWCQNDQEGLKHGEN